MPSLQASTTDQNGRSSPGADQPNDQKDPKQPVDRSPEISIRKLQKTTSWLARDKLSREFQSINDEGELGKLMGDSGEKLLAFVDDIRKIESLRNIELDIPQLVVVGDTSTGKSSVLQALTRLPFPVAGELCTRFVTETTIRRCTSSEKPGYRIEVKMDMTSHNGDPPFQPKIFDSNEWIDVYQNLKQDIADAFDLMSPNNLLPSTGSRMSDPSAKSSGSAVQKQHPIPQLMRHRLQISVRKPDQAHFSIVDIPGLVSSGARADIRLSEELAVEYIRNREAIVLAVTPADNVLENQKVFTLVQENGASDRTIGVITRCDRIEETNEDKIFNLLRNRNDSLYHLKLGWFAVRNRSSKEILDESSFEERDKKETELFENGKWKEAVSSPSYVNSIDPNVLGIKYLKRTLQESLYKRVKENFPLLKIKMKALKKKYQEQLQSMGDPRDNERDQRVYLSDIQTRYESEVERSLNGNYRTGLPTNHASRLRHHIQDFNGTFEASIEYKALKYAWQSLDTDAPESQGQPGEEPRGGIFKWIDQTWDYLRGSESRLDPPQSLKKELFKEQTYSWESRARVYMEKVDNAIRDCNADLFKIACQDDTLLAKVQEKLESLEISAFTAAERELQQIISDLDYVDSWNPTLVASINEFQLFRMSGQASGTNQSKLPGNSVITIEQHALQYKDFYVNNKRVFEVHDWLLGYWRCAFPRFVDNIIIQVVERHLLGRKGPLRLFNRHWIDCLSKEELEELVGDDEATVNERKAIRERVEDLDDALKKADIALR